MRLALILTTAAFGAVSAAALAPFDHTGAGPPTAVQWCGSRGMAPCSGGKYCQFDEEAQCGHTDKPGACIEKPMICSQEYAPICGCDGKTYSNGCIASSKGVSMKSRGACEKDPNGSNDGKSEEPGKHVSLPRPERAPNQLPPAKMPNYSGSGSTNWQSRMRELANKHGMSMRESATNRKNEVRRMSKDQLGKRKVELEAAAKRDAAAMPHGFARFIVRDLEPTEQQKVKQWVEGEMSKKGVKGTKVHFQKEESKALLEKVEGWMKGAKHGGGGANEGSTGGAVDKPIVSKPIVQSPTARPQIKPTVPVKESGGSTVASPRGFESKPAGVAGSAAAPATQTVDLASQFTARGGQVAMTLAPAGFAAGQPKVMTIVVAEVPAQEGDATAAVDAGADFAAQFEGAGMEGSALSKMLAASNPKADSGVMFPQGGRGRFEGRGEVRVAEGEVAERDAMRRLVAAAVAGEKLSQEKTETKETKASKEVGVEVGPDGKLKGVAGSGAVEGEKKLERKPEMDPAEAEKKWKEEQAKKGGNIDRPIMTATGISKKDLTAKNGGADGNTEDGASKVKGEWESRGKDETTEKHEGKGGEMSGSKGTQEKESAAKERGESGEHWKNGAASGSDGKTKQWEMEMAYKKAEWERNEKAIREKKEAAMKVLEEKQLQMKELTSKWEEARKGNGEKAVQAAAGLKMQMEKAVGDVARVQLENFGRMVESVVEKAAGILRKVADFANTLPNGEEKKKILQGVEEKARKLKSDVEEVRAKVKAHIEEKKAKWEAHWAQVEKKVQEAAVKATDVAVASGIGNSLKGQGAEVTVEAVMEKIEKDMDAGMAAELKKWKAGGEAVPQEWKAKVSALMRRVEMMEAEVASATGQMYEKKRSELDAWKEKMMTGGDVSGAKESAEEKGASLSQGEESNEKDEKSWVEGKDNKEWSKGEKGEGKQWGQGKGSKAKDGASGDKIEKDSSGEKEIGKMGQGGDKWKDNLMATTGMGVGKGKGEKKDGEDMGSGKGLGARPPRVERTPEQVRELLQKLQTREQVNVKAKDKIMSKLEKLREKLQKLKEKLAALKDKGEAAIAAAPARIEAEVMGEDSKELTNSLVGTTLQCVKRRRSEPSLCEREQAKWAANPRANGLNFTCAVRVCGGEGNTAISGEKTDAVAVENGASVDSGASANADVAAEAGGATASRARDAKVAQNTGADLLDEEIFEEAVVDAVCADSVSGSNCWKAGMEVLMCGDTKVDMCMRGGVEVPCAGLSCTVAPHGSAGLASGSAGSVPVEKKIEVDITNRTTVGASAGSPKGLLGLLGLLFVLPLTALIAFVAFTVHRRKATLAAKQAAAAAAPGQGYGSVFADSVPA